MSHKIDWRHQTKANITQTFQWTEDKIFFLSSQYESSHSQPSVAKSKADLLVKKLLPLINDLAWAPAPLPITDHLQSLSIKITDQNEFKIQMIWLGLRKLIESILQL